MSGAVIRRAGLKSVASPPPTLMRRAIPLPAPLAPPVDASPHAAFVFPAVLARPYYGPVAERRLASGSTREGSLRRRVRRVVAWYTPDISLVGHRLGRVVHIVLCVSRGRGFGPPHAPPRGHAYEPGSRHLIRSQLLLLGGPSQDCI